MKPIVSDQAAASTTNLNHQNKNQNQEINWFNPTNPHMLMYVHNQPVGYDYSQYENQASMQTLAYPAALSHQLATLTIDQHNYLLQQQRQLVLALAAAAETRNQAPVHYLPYVYQQQQFDLPEQVQLHFSSSQKASNK